MDNHDWDKVRACFAKDAVIKHGSFSGPASQFLEFVIDIVSKTENCAHLVEKVDLHSDGDVAIRQTRFSSRQRISGKYEKVGPVVTQGVDVEWRVEGRYIDRLVQVDGTWKIIERQGYNDHSETWPL